MRKKVLAVFAFLFISIGFPLLWYRVFGIQGLPWAIGFCLLIGVLAANGAYHSEPMKGNWLKIYERFMLMIGLIEMIAIWLLFEWLSSQSFFDPDPITNVIQVTAIILGAAAILFALGLLLYAIAKQFTWFHRSDEEEKK